MLSPRLSCFNLLPSCAIQCEVAYDEEPNQDSRRHAKAHEHGIGESTPGNEKSTSKEKQEDRESEWEEEIGGITDDPARPGHVWAFHCQNGTAEFKEAVS